MKLKRQWLGALLFLFCLSLHTPAEAKFSLHVTDGDVREVLTSLAQISGRDILVDDSVTGRITLQLEDVETAEALELITRLKGLSYEERYGTIVVGTKTAMARNFAGMHVFPVHFADLADVGAVLDLPDGAAGTEKPAADNKETATAAKAKGAERGLAGKRRFVLDKAANQVIFYGTEAEADLVAKTIALLDVPSKQVSLEAKVIAIQKDAAKNLGVEWEWSKLPQYPEYTTQYESVQRAVENSDGSHTTVTEDIPTTTVERSWNNGTAGGIVQFGHGPDGHPFEFYYTAQLNALVSDGKANVLASPNIMTLQGREAVINIGGEVPVPTVSTTNATTTTSLEYRQAGIILRYTPRVNDDGYITADVHTEVSSPLYIEELKAYRFQKRSADTMVRLKNGETMVIAGLIGSEEARSLSKVPFLGDLPILGHFFRNEKTSKTESEIMIFLTAHIVE